MTINYKLPDNKTQQFPVAASLAVSIGDLMYWDTSAKKAKPITSLTTGATESADQVTVASLFLGVSNDQVLSTETAPTNKTLTVDGVFDADCPSQTFNPGDLVGATWDGGSALVAQKVTKVNNEHQAIGVVTQYYSSATTTVRCKLLSRYASDVANSVGFMGANSTPVPRPGNAFRCTTQLDKTTSTTLSDITGLSVTLLAGRKYIVRAKLFTTSTVNGGLKIGLGGTATATSLIAEVKSYTTTTNNLSAQATALGSIGGATVATDSAEVWAEIVVNAGGTLTIQAAQNASHADTTSIKVGSFMVVEDVV